MASYPETVAWLQRLEVTSGWDLKLERMRAALAACGHPERAFPAVHVAGTNGKGSTAAMVEAVLRQAGCRTGLYTSPHLVDFAERIRAGGRTIPHDAVVALVEELRATLDRAGIALTHFEFCTLLAFAWFARIGIDVGVIEVGLGGRLDATNTVHAVVTAVTSIARDHEEWLGHGLTRIAFEKAGIAKPRVPLVVGRLPDDALEVVLRACGRGGRAAVRAGHDGSARAGGDFRGPDGVASWRDLVPGVPGRFQSRQRRGGAARCSRCSRERFGGDGGRRARGPGRACSGLAGWPWCPSAPLVLSTERTIRPAWRRWRPSCPASLGPAVWSWCSLSWPTRTGRRCSSLCSHRRRGGRRRGLARAASIPDGLTPRRSRRTCRLGVVDDPHEAVEAAARARAPGEGAVLVAGSLFLAGDAYATLAPGTPLFEPWQGWPE